jgi:CheY-like chemotaxis protein
MTVEERTRPIEGRQGARVLVVDNRPDMLELVSDYLAILGLRPVTADNGPDALARVGEGVDLALVDIRMPEMDGIALLRTIRQHNRTLPVLLMTGHPLPEEYAEAERLWISGLLRKPFGLAELRAAIAAALPPGGAKEDRQP